MKVRAVRPPPGASHRRPPVPAVRSRGDVPGSGDGRRGDDGRGVQAPRRAGAVRGPGRVGHRPGDRRDHLAGRAGAGSARGRPAAVPGPRRCWRRGRLSSARGPAVPGPGYRGGSAWDSRERRQRQGRPDATSPRRRTAPAVDETGRRAGSITGSAAGSSRNEPAGAGPVYNPPRARSPATSTSPRSRRWTRPSLPRDAFSGLARHQHQKRTEIMFRIRNLVDQHRRGDRRPLTSEHGKVPSDALGEVARGSRTSSSRPASPPAQGRLQRAGLDRGRRLPDPPATGRRRRASRPSTSRPWCRCGCSPTPSPAATPSS